ncbi:sushi, nidogen and EGF-like domain-containing protein 1 isoform X2 [Heliangelus exortis]|uniref:sushi, nidogen and EGF-like domain-containing protein 1 isoform X2 n=1 Tax=Heliangelus exortis TaxID=472823 RepID=UPI003A8D8B2C
METKFTFSWASRGGDLWFEGQREEGRVCAMGLLLLTMLTTLVSCGDPEAMDSYWSGTAPICLGGCQGKHKELKRSRCGDGSCCWLGYKSFCRVNCGRPEAELSSVVHGNDFWVGSVVRYSCQPGFLLLGDPASACQSNGHWTPKPTCLRICLRGRIEIREQDISGKCSSSCSTQTHLGATFSHGCIKVSDCVPKSSGWARWFLRCDICECDCHVPCASSG